MIDEFTVIFYRFPCVLSEDFIFEMDRDIIWGNTTQESWYDYVAMWCSLAV